MAGETANTAVWGEADVLIGALSATIPSGNAAFTINDPDAATPVTGEWDYVGLLSGEDGFTENVEVESTDHNAWGYGVVATTYSGQKTTKTFTSLEDNPTVLSLLYDTAGVTFNADGSYEGDLGVKDFTERVLIAFVTRSGGNEKRMISAGYATIAASGAAAESEDSLQSKQFTATIVPDSNKILWHSYRGPEAA